MKHFIFSKETGTWNRRSGGMKLTFSVYEVNKNVPRHVGNVEAYSSAYKGDESTVMNYLADAKKIPAKHSEGYYQYDKENFRIHKV